MAAVETRDNGRNSFDSLAAVEATRLILADTLAMGRACNLPWYLHEDVAFGACVSACSFSLAFGPVASQRAAADYRPRMQR